MNKKPIPIAEKTINMWGQENVSFNQIYKPWKDIDDPKNVFFVSIHGFGGNDPIHSGFYPGTGATLVPPMIDEQSINLLVES